MMNMMIVAVISQAKATRFGHIKVVLYSTHLSLKTLNVVFLDACQASSPVVLVVTFCDMYRQEEESAVSVSTHLVCGACDIEP